ncbi:MAG TPA: hypothetical protein VK425_11940 [Acidimicrobiales bacterium]|nr:hypothetical protein [Acidimicrobiales bacterium]
MPGKVGHWFAAKNGHLLAPGLAQDASLFFSPAVLTASISGDGSSTTTTTSTSGATTTQLLTGNGPLTPPVEVCGTSSLDSPFDYSSSATSVSSYTSGTAGLPSGPSLK